MAGDSKNPTRAQTKGCFHVFPVTEPCSMLVLTTQTSTGRTPRLRGAKASVWAYCSVK